MDNQCDKKPVFFAEKEYFCSLELAMDLIGGKWKSMMIFHLKDGSMRSGDLQRTLSGITNKMFTQTARELEVSGFVERIVYPVVPPKVEYKLTSLGESVLPLILRLAEWGYDIAEKR